MVTPHRYSSCQLSVDESHGSTIRYATAKLLLAQVKELSDKLDATLSDLDHSNTAKEDMRRRHEALIDDRESVERDHQVHIYIYVQIHVYIYKYTDTYVIYIVLYCVRVRVRVCISVERDQQAQTDEMMAEPSTRSLRPHILVA